ncbi:hypothetical protein BCR39DRAFT_599464 [Naematelia encephala]|uniref:Transmembrane protein n=1 Tax=Naematelia encephala TaxID=71784 RepID=A0A1Y2AX50_9TREE|nr:hypothetical protein BCR39DRAFT_599464 [Naematelia encephala]
MLISTRYSSFKSPTDFDQAVPKSPEWFKPVWTTVNAPPPHRPRRSHSPPSPTSMSEDESLPPLEASRRPWQKHSRASVSCLSDSELGLPPKHFRPRFASAPSFGSIEEETSSEEDEISTPVGLSEALDPFQMLLPYCESRLAKARSSFDKSFDASERVAGHVPAKSVNINAFKPRFPRVPRYQRPLVTIVFCALLFGTLCVVSFLQQSLAASERTLVVHQGEWLIRNAGTVHTQAELIISQDTELDLSATRPVHHKLFPEHKQEQAES